MGVHILDKAHRTDEKIKWYNAYKALSIMSEISDIQPFFKDQPNHVEEFY